jgi:uncharacterized membrane protein
MKKYFKAGLALIVPIALVYQVLIWVYNFSEGLLLEIIPDSLGYQWWYTLVAILGVAVIIFLLGLTFTILAPARWIKTKIDKYIIHKVPVVNTIYKFGTEVSDSFIADVKDDGDLQMVEVDFGVMKMMGVLTDAKNDLVFVISAPSPLTGFVIKTKNYKFVNMKFIDAVKINTSLGRVNGDKWD